MPGERGAAPGSGPEARPRGPGVGDPVPAFALVNQYGETVTETTPGSDPFFLVFYPFAFSRVCTSELSELEAARGDFATRGVRVYGVSVDHKFALRAYAQELGLGFELLADFWPHGAAARSFGCFDDAHGRAARATFLVADGHIAARFDSAVGASRPLTAYRLAVEALPRD
ncbi:redoxin domain-containing protein [Arthrobacter halodurans]|uniref:thioredoxin-dependent peroxiredoxin n=1 Tax=Arthrobacter halodurans TaxID=516699 RepID=A0ABV4UHY0_9MICC